MSITITPVVTDLSKEVWRPVVGYEGLFEVSSRGRVRGVDRLVWNKGGRSPRWTHIPGKLKTPWYGGRYPVIRLCKNGKKFTVPVHRLVAEAFLGPPPTLQHEVCHRGGVWNGDELGNLYWGTRADNMADAKRHGTIARGQRSGTAKLTESDVLEIRIRRSLGEKLRVLAARFRVSQGAISLAARGKTWS